MAEPGLWAQLSDLIAQGTTVDLAEVTRTVYAAGLEDGWKAGHEAGYHDGVAHERWIRQALRDAGLGDD